jgi:hypothetical protein
MIREGKYMAKSESEKIYQREYRKKHPEYDRTYRERHKTEIAEYNRLHPELRVRLSLEEHAMLHKLFRDVPSGIRGLIRAAFSRSV